MPADPPTLLYEKDAPLAPLEGATVAVIGFGNQGHAHALNLHDSGIRTIVGARQGSVGGRLAVDLGLRALSIAEAVRAAELVIIALPDEAQPEVFECDIAPHLAAGRCVGFIHGMNIHFGLIKPPAGVDVVMVAPKGPGHALRARFQAGGGLPCLVAVAQDATGHARRTALAWASGIGCARAGILETSFREECVTDLFGEQAVLCGGLVSLMKAGVETLVEAGYSPEMAYFECVHEVKLIVDLIHAGGLEQMWRKVSNTAEYGGLTRGPRLIDGRLREAMRRVLAEVESGEFAREWRQEHLSGQENLQRLRRDEVGHIAETAGQRVRGWMPWLGG